MKEMHAWQPTHVIVVIELAQTYGTFLVRAARSLLVLVRERARVDVLLVRADVAAVVQSVQLLFHAQ